MIRERYAGCLALNFCLFGRKYSASVVIAFAAAVHQEYKFGGSPAHGRIYETISRFVGRGIHRGEAEALSGSTVWGPGPGPEGKADKVAPRSGHGPSLPIRTRLKK